MLHYLLLVNRPRLSSIATRSSLHAHTALRIHFERTQDSVIQWDEALSSIRAVLEGWLEVQAKWAHLAPLFGPSGLPGQLPIEVCVCVCVCVCECVCVCVCKAFCFVIILRGGRSLKGALNLC
jgi:hypothetical protein